MHPPEEQQPPITHNNEEVPPEQRFTPHNDTWVDIPLLHEKSVHEHGRKTTGVVSKQMDSIMNPQKKEKARLQFQKGNFWTGAKKQSTQDIHKCWPDFFEMRVFNWGGTH